MAGRYQKSGKKVIDTSTGKWLSPEKSQHYANISGGWNYLPNYVAPKAPPAGQPLVNKVEPTQTPTPTAPAQQPQTAKQPSLLEIYEARQDVKDEVERLYPGQNPTVKGTEANRWLNDWYNRVGKAEGADMASKGMFDQPAETKPLAPVEGVVDGGIPIDTEEKYPATTKTTRSLIDIANSRPDVLATAKAQGGDPFTAGTPANNWLNNWWNTAGKNEFPDVILGEPIDEQTQITNEANEVMEEFFDNLPDGDDLEISDSQLLLDEILAKIESGEGVPDKPPSMAELFAETKASLGMEELETELADIDAQIDEINSELMIQAEEAGYGQQLVTTAQLGRKKGSLQREAENRIQRLNIQRGAVARMLNNKISSLNMTMSFLQQDYANATAYYKANFDKSIAVYKLYADQEDREMKIEDRARDEAKANFAVIYNALSDGNLSYENLTEDQKTQIRQLENEAGFMSGFMESLEFGDGSKIQSVTSRKDASGQEFFDVLRINNKGELRIESISKGYGVVAGGARGTGGVSVSGGTVETPEGQSYDLSTVAGIKSAIADGYDPASIRSYLDTNTKLTVDSINALMKEGTVGVETGEGIEWTQEVVLSLKSQGVSDDELLAMAKKDGVEDQVSGWLEEEYSEGFWGGLAKDVYKYGKIPYVAGAGLIEKGATTVGEKLKSWLKL